MKFVMFQPSEAISIESSILKRRVAEFAEIAGGISMGKFSASSAPLRF